jgi:O-antigen/teichoic acid export membrane protein
MAITVGAILSLIVNLLLVQSMASLGTTIALLVAEGVGAMIQIYFARKYLIIPDFIRLFLKYFTLSMMVYISVTVIGTYVKITPLLLTILQVVVGGLLYFMGLLVIKDTMIMRVIPIVKTRLLKKKSN